MHNSNQNTPFPTGGAACFYDDIVVATYDGGTPPAGGVIGVYDAVRGF
jgi:hypothetical protein